MMCEPIMLSAKLLRNFGRFPGIRVSIPSTLLSTILNRTSIDALIVLKDPLERVSAKITLCLKVAPTVTLPVGPPALDLQSLYSLNQMTKVVKSLPSEDLNKLSPAWVRFIKSLNIVVSNAQKISEVRKLCYLVFGVPVLT